MEDGGGAGWSRGTHVTVGARTFSGGSARTRRLLASPLQSTRGGPRHSRPHLAASDVIIWWYCDVAGRQSPVERQQEPYGQKPNAPDWHRKNNTGTNFGMLTAAYERFPLALSHSARAAHGHPTCGQLIHYNTGLYPCNGRRRVFLIPGGQPAKATRHATGQGWRINGRHWTPPAGRPYGQWVLVDTSGPVGVRRHVHGVRRARVCRSPVDLCADRLEASAGVRGRGIETWAQSYQRRE